MLIRNNQVAPAERYYEDSLAKLPTLSQSIYHNLALGFVTPFVAMNDLNSEMARSPEGRSIHDAMDAMRITESTPGMGIGQEAVGFTSNIIGSLFNPINLAAGEIGGLAARGVAGAAAKLTPTAALVLARKPISQLLKEPIGSYIPAMIGKEGFEKPLSTALLSESALHSFGVGAGFGLPQGIDDSFNRDTGHIEWGGVAREMGEMGAFGVAIGSIPFALGVLKGKVNRLRGEDASSSITLNDVSKLYENNKISHEEFEWYKDYTEHLRSPQDTGKLEELKSRASDIVSSHGHKVNSATNEVPFDIISAKDIDNLKSGISDQLASDIPEQYKSALSDFIVRGNLDRHTENPIGIDGIRGYSDFIKEKMDKRAEKTAESNKILDDHLEKGIKENMPFSQKELFKMIKRSGFEQSHVSNLPLTIPENIKSYLGSLHEIDNLKFKNKEYLRRFEKTKKKKYLFRIKENDKKILQIEKSFPKILTPKEELSNIRKFLLNEKGLPKKWNRSVAYHRLIDLAHVWKNARTLLDRVHMERDYEKQSAFKTILDHVIKAADSVDTQFAKPENVVDYLKARIEGHIQTQESVSVFQFAVDESQRVPSDSDGILKDQHAQINKSSSEDLKKDFDLSSAKFKEFKNSGNVLKNLIACVRGGLSG